jgi:hypothetical protein
MWEIHAGAPTKSVPAPNARVHIEELKFAVAGILLKLDLDESCEAG